MMLFSEVALDSSFTDAASRLVIVTHAISYTIWGRLTPKVHLAFG